MLGLAIDDFENSGKSEAKFPTLSRKARQGWGTLGLWAMYIIIAIMYIQ